MGFGAQTRINSYLGFQECNRISSGSSSTKAIVAGQVYVGAFFITRLVTIDQITLLTTGGATGNVSVALFPAGTQPWNSKISIGPTATTPVPTPPSIDSPMGALPIIAVPSTPVAATITISVNQQLQPGTYWLGVLFDTAVGNFIKNHSLIEFSCFADIASGTPALAAASGTWLNGGRLDLTFNATVNPPYTMPPAFGFSTIAGVQTGAGAIPGDTTDDTMSPQAWLRVASVDD